MSQSWEEQACMVYLMCDKDVRETWGTMQNDDLVSACAEDVLTLWQQLLQMQDNQLVSVLYQYKNSKGIIKTKALLFTLENEYLLVCNGTGSNNLVIVSMNEMADLCNWWSSLPLMHVPLLHVHPMYKKVFGSDLNVKPIHLFTETHDMIKNTNLRLAQFNMICEAASRKEQNHRK